jgi:hypothetical protein
MRSSHLVDPVANVERPEFQFPRFATTGSVSRNYTAKLDLFGSKNGAPLNPMVENIVLTHNHMEINLGKYLLDKSI